MNFLTVRLPLDIDIYNKLSRLAIRSKTSIDKLIVKYLESRVKQEFAKNYKTA